LYIHPFPTRRSSDLVKMGKTVPLVDHIQPKAAVPGDRPQEDVASPAVDVVDPLIEHDDAGEMSAIDDVYFGQGFLVDFFETVGMYSLANWWPGRKRWRSKTGFFLKKCLSM